MLTRSALPAAVLQGSQLAKDEKRKWQARRLRRGRRPEGRPFSIKSTSASKGAAIGNVMGQKSAARQRVGAGGDK